MSKILAHSEHLTKSVYRLNDLAKVTFGKRKLYLSSLSCQSTEMRIGEKLTSGKPKLVNQWLESYKTDLESTISSLNAAQYESMMLSSLIPKSKETSFLPVTKMATYL